MRRPAILVGGALTLGLILGLGLARGLAPGAGPAGLEDRSGNYWLKRYLELRYPALEDPELSDAQRVRVLRRWASRTADRAERMLQMDFRAFESGARSVASVYEAFEHDEAGVMCANNARSFRALLAQFGYESWYFNMGFDSGPVKHSVLLVRLQVEGEPRLVFQDVHWNLSFVDRQGKPLEARRMLELLSAGRHDQIEILRDRDEHDSLRLGQDGEVTKSLRRNDIDVIDATKGIARHLAQRGHPEHWLYLYLYPRQSGAEALSQLLPEALASLPTS